MVRGRVPVVCTTPVVGQAITIVKNGDASLVLCEVFAIGTRWGADRKFVIITQKYFKKKINTLKHSTLKETEILN